MCENVYVCVSKTDGPVTKSTSVVRRYPNSTPSSRSQHLLRICVEGFTKGMGETPVLWRGEVKVDVVLTDSRGVTLGRDSSTVPVLRVPDEGRLLTYDVPVSHGFVRVRVLCTVKRLSTETELLRDSWNDLEGIRRVTRSYKGGLEGRPRGKSQCECSVKPPRGSDRWKEG